MMAEYIPKYPQANLPIYSFFQNFNYGDLPQTERDMGKLGRSQCMIDGTCPITAWTVIGAPPKYFLPYWWEEEQLAERLTEKTTYGYEAGEDTFVIYYDDATHKREILTTDIRFFRPKLLGFETFVRKVGYTEYPAILIIIPLTNLEPSASGYKTLGYYHMYHRNVKYFYKIDSEWVLYDEDDYDVYNYCHAKVEFKQDTLFQNPSETTYQPNISIYDKRMNALIEIGKILYPIE